MNSKFLCLCWLVCLLSMGRSGVEAQVVEDGSLSTEVKTQNNNNFIIDGGESRGSNLFHSFAEFSIPTNGSVLFNNPLTIENIITRVTGSSLSNIDGSIASNGNANLFLINPNGIIFGENASLSLGGAFIATTAESLVFTDGMKFESNLQSSAPLLTVSVPLGLQFGNNPGDIVNQTSVLTTQGKTLGLLGGNITFDGGTVTTFGGNVELGSVAENSFVTLESIATGWQASYEGVNQFQDIGLDNLALIDASGAGAGDINVSARNIRLFNGSAIISNTQGATDGGAIAIQASESLEINGSDITGTKIDPFLADFEIFLPFASQISTTTVGEGKGADIKISARNVQLLDGGLISLQTLAFDPNTRVGEGGNLELQLVEGLELQGFRPLLGLGDNAASKVAPLDVDLAVDINQVSRISNSSLSGSNGGDININAKRVSIADGTSIATTPFGEGSGGDINLTITESIVISGVSPRTNSANSVIAANTFNAGNSGNIRVATKNLTVDSGGQITTAAASPGRTAGDINVNAERIKIVGRTANNSFVTGIFAQAFDLGIGGDVSLDTTNLIISDRGNLSVRGVGSGIAGNLRINASNIELNNFASINAATEFQSGGNIELNVLENLTLNNNSTISALATGDANGGNLNIDVGFLIANPNENNDILATAVQGDGGNIRLSGEGIFGLGERSSRPPNSTNDIDASSEFGRDGTVIFDFPALDESSFALVLEELLRLRSFNLGDDFCSVSFASEYNIVGRDGEAFLPEGELELETSWADFRFFDDGKPGKTTEFLSEREVPDNKKIEMIEPIQGWVRDRAGKIVLTAESPRKALNSLNLPSPYCDRKERLNN